MEEIHSIGFDVHHKTIAIHDMDSKGKKCNAWIIGANRNALMRWLIEEAPTQWQGAMEATLFTAWIYDELKKHNPRIYVGDPQMLTYIAKTKKKNDRLDARKLANLLRCDLFPAIHMPDPQTRYLRGLLRHRNFVVRQITRFKNNTTGHLMSNGVLFEERKLHGKKYFARLLEESQIPEELLVVLQINRRQIDFLRDVERMLLRRLLSHNLLHHRLLRLMSIPGVGVITALSWCLEIDRPERFRSAAQAISYCGLCAAQKESGGKSQRGPLSPKRNKHLQWVLIEAAKIAVQYNEKFSTVYDKTKAKRNANAASIAVARKLVTFLLALDKSGEVYRNDYNHTIN
jgi:transposase